MLDVLKAARNGDLATIKRLYADGVNLTDRGLGGLTAIMVTAMHGHTTTVKFLHTKGASIFEKNDNGSSALHLAAWDGNLSLVQYFPEEAGASISQTARGRTIWNTLKTKNADPVDLASLLKVMVMLGDAPPTFAAKLSPANAEIIYVSLSGALLRLDHHVDILIMPGDHHDHVISGTGPDGIISHTGDRMRILFLSMQLGLKDISPMRPAAVS
jgi:hypothetical protein